MQSYLEYGSVNDRRSDYMRLTRDDPCFMIGLCGFFFLIMVGKYTN